MSNNYVQRNERDPFLYSAKEPHTEAFKVNVEVDGQQVDFRSLSFCFDCGCWFAGEQHDCGGKQVA